MKLHVLVATCVSGSVDVVGRGCGAASATHSFFETIVDAARYVVAGRDRTNLRFGKGGGGSGVAREGRGVEAAVEDAGCQCSLTANDVRWLVATAFFTVLCLVPGGVGAAGGISGDGMLSGCAS